MNDKTVTVKVPFSWIDTMLKVIPERLFKDVILGVLLHDDEKRCDPVFTTEPCENRRPLHIFSRHPTFLKFSERMLARKMIAVLMLKSHMPESIHPRMKRIPKETASTVMKQ
jgi:hypothetical protein